LGNNSDYLDQLLNVFWLRPETALWRSIDIETMSDFEIVSPSLDLGCGDGIFSFIRAGGKFEKSFDAFQSIGKIENYFNNIDIYDHFDNSLNPSVTGKPKYEIDVAFDHKENLLNKAKTLNFYKNFIRGDANDKLPFDNDSFQSIFSNIIYWLNNPEMTFKELFRILKPGGQCCIMLPNKSFVDFLFYNKYFLKNGDEQYRFLEKLDRGRLAELIQVTKSSDEWKTLIYNSGLKIRSHKKHLSKTVVQIWDIGLRPLFPALLKMVQAIDSAQLPEIKKNWVDILRMFIEPISKMDGELDGADEPGFHCFILQK